MSNKIVWSKPSPWPVLLKAAALTSVVVVALVFVLRWLDIGSDLVRFVSLLGGTLAGIGYAISHRRAPPNQ